MTSDTLIRRLFRIATTAKNSVVPAKSIIITGVCTAILILLSLLFFILNMLVPAIIASLIALVTGTFAFAAIINLIRKMNRSSNELKGMQINHGEAIAYFSHNIRETLNNLVIIGELLSGTELSARQRDMVETLIASTTNMVSTVNEMAVQTAGSIDPEKRKPIRFNLVSAVQNTLELFNMRSDDGIRFSIESEAKDGVDLIGDPIVIKQIVLDILNTLSKDTSGSKSELKIHVNMPAEDGTLLTVTLSFRADTGFISDDPDSDNKSLALKLIEANQGRYSYDLAETGATLTVALLFGRPETIDSKRIIASPRLTELGKETVRKKEMMELSLLLVEDNAINQKITFLTLKPLVKLIDTASDGREALDRMATANYDIILMDIQMPVMDGLVAAEKIRALEKSTGKHVPIIAITANAMLGDKERCLSAGMDDYISKPFQPAMLLEKIRKFL